MDTFTPQGDPRIEQVVGSHMERIVTAIRTGMEPEAILLRGSFGKGEGNVLLENGRLKFLSDYEINVVTLSFWRRRFLYDLAERLSEEFGVQTSIVWMRPDYFRRQRVGPFADGPVPITISLYETRYGSRVLYGRDVLEAAPSIEPACISVASGLQLMLNRMAEALHYLPEPGGTTANEWESIFWINKLVLACIESLLVSWGQYHYSYRERGRRFPLVAMGRLGFMGDEAEALCGFAERATQFKLRSARELYPEPLDGTTAQVVSMCSRVFSHLAAQEWALTADSSDPGYPEQYLRSQVNRLTAFSQLRALYKLLDVYRYLHTRRLPLNLFSPNTASEVIYSIVPLLFAVWGQPETALPPLLQVARRHMRRISPIPQPAASTRAEWHQLCEQMLMLWKNFST